MILAGQSRFLFFHFLTRFIGHIISLLFSILISTNYTLLKLLSFSTSILLSTFQAKPIDYDMHLAPSYLHLGTLFLFWALEILYERIPTFLHIFLRIGKAISFLSFSFQYHPSESYCMYSSYYSCIEVPLAFLKDFLLVFYSLKVNPLNQFILTAHLLFDRQVLRSFHEAH